MMLIVEDDQIQIIFLVVVTATVLTLKRGTTGRKDRVTAKATIGVVGPVQEVKGLVTLTQELTVQFPKNLEIDTQHMKGKTGLDEASQFTGKSGMVNILQGNMKIPGMYEVAAEKEDLVAIEKLCVQAENAMAHLVVPETIPEGLEDLGVL
jgi:hypothetical protein